MGLPRKDTFIWGDYEYLARIREHGFKVFYNFASKIRHPPHPVKKILLPIGIIKLKSPIWRPFQVYLGPPWKQYYGIRNAVFFSARYKKGTVSTIKAILGAVLRTCILVLYEKRDRMKLIRYCLKGIVDGLRGKMGVNIKP